MLKLADYEFLVKRIFLKRFDSENKLREFIEKSLDAQFFQPTKSTEYAAIISYKEYVTYAIFQDMAFHNTALLSVYSSNRDKFKPKPVYALMNKIINDTYGKNYIHVAVQKWAISK